MTLDTREELTQKTSLKLDVMSLPLASSPSIQYPTFMKVTLKNLAEACGMDISTVSRGLRDDPRVKEETRKEIKGLAADMGYRPNLAARTLVAGKSRTIWFLLPSLRHSLEQLPAQQAALYLTEKYNYDMLVALHHSDEETYCRLIDRLTQGVADGVIIIPGPTKSGGGYVKPLLDQNYPMVFLDRHPKKVNASCVVTDNFSASFDMIENAYQDGARAVIDITGAIDNNAADARSKGVKEACVKHEIELIQCNSETIITEKLPKKIVIFGSTQSWVCDFFRKNKGFAQKHEITVCCFDQWFGEPYPAQKIVLGKQDFTTMSETACDMLVEMIEGKKIVKSIEIPIYETQVIESA